MTYLDPQIQDAIINGITDPMGVVVVGGTALLIVLHSFNGVRRLLMSATGLTR
jgi:succinate dehydrogenase/fumarate reductase cytochrome b subunit